MIINSYWRSSLFKKLSAFAALLLTFVLFQNFDFAEAWKVNLLPFNEKARKAHAQELLGKHYSKSPASQVEQATSLGMHILNEVHKNLPKKHKAAAVDLATTILQESEKYEIDPVFVVAVIKTESSFNPLARGSVGEIGLMQIRPQTGEWIAKKFDIPWKGPRTLENPSMNVRIGMAYFNYLRERFDGHANKYVSAYNMGYSKVCQMYAQDRKPQEYSSRVMKHYSDTYKRLAMATTFSLLAGN